jgi:hypothetical protein
MKIEVVFDGVAYEVTGSYYSEVYHGVPTDGLNDYEETPDYLGDDVEGFEEVILDQFKREDENEEIEHRARRPRP